MAIHIKLKEAFDVDLQYGAFYTGGLVAWTSNGSEFLCQDGGKINVISVDSGNIIKRIGAPEEEKYEIEEDLIYTFDLSRNEEYLVTAHKSGLLKLWSKDSGELLKQWKGSHKGPIAKVSLRTRSSVLASGGSDSSIRIWDHEKKTCLAALRGSQGVFSLLEFFPNLEESLIIGAADDNKINVWDYEAKTLVASFAGHFSKVTAISFTNDHKKFVSVSRDKVLILWDFVNKSQIRTIPLYEALEGVTILTFDNLPKNCGIEENSDHIFAAIAGELGSIKIWECTKSKIIYEQNNSIISKASEEGGLAITQLLHCTKTNQLAVVSADHNIMVHNISTFHCAKQLIGFSDEILDICFVGKKGRYLAVATNSSDIKLYDNLNMNCQVLKGHTDIVLALSSHKNLLLSSAKDNTIRIWEINPGDFTARCVAKGAKHTASIGSVTFGNVSPTICVSASQDRCVKVWDIPKIFSTSEEIINLTCSQTTLAHEKDINCVAISPNDRMIATASQDKTAKLWSSDGLSTCLGTLRGHRRGIWCCRFSPTDQVLLTTSADSTIRLWSLSNMSCLKSIEGHESSVLKAEFLTKGMQILSAGADGLLKIWTIKNSECNATLDKHESRIWSIAVAPDETYFYSGGSDSQIIRWKDVTEEKKVAEFNERQEVALQEQELNNLIAQKKMLKALRLALRLEKPYLTLKIINSVIQSQEDGLGETIKSLNDLHKESLMKHAITWNTNSRNTLPAQLVLNILMEEILANKFRPSGLGKMIEDSLPYTDRHFKRATEYLKDLNFIKFTLNCMQPFSSKMETDNI